MSLPGKVRPILNFEQDIAAAGAGLNPTAPRASHGPQDLGQYLDFLEEIGAFQAPKLPSKFYSKIFTL